MEWIIVVPADGQANSTAARRAAVACCVQPVRNAMASCGERTGKTLLATSLWDLHGCLETGLPSRFIDRGWHPTSCPCYH
eukprot:6879014-Karenia_brevis.AAC.1